MKFSFGKMILLFTVVPFVELFILLELANRTSAITTLGLIVVTGVIGAYFAKEQGRKVINHIRMELNSGRMPGNGLLHGLCVLVGGLLLLTPGILTDIFGFSLLFPATRVKYIEVIKHYIKNNFHLNNTNIY